MNRFTMQRRIAIALLLALSVGGVLILLDGHNPFEAYKVLFLESFLNYWGFSNTLVKASPMLLAGLAVIIPMRAGVFNIGGEGQ
ncbi:MAG TPA: ABC transporter permease, partial [Gammaproteobacteria bacterium]|nr:ABC transporter permease [Gammaproteobacteria bacterium]